MAARSDVAAFNPNQPPAETKAKTDIAREAMTAEARHIASEWEVGAWPRRTVLTHKEVERHLPHHGVDASGRKLADGLKADGFVILGVHPMMAGTAGLHVKTTWYAREGIAWSPALRDTMLAEMPSRFT